MSPTVAVESHGCKLNQAEAEALTRRFQQAGYAIVNPDAGADIYILNTCTVTHIADRKARSALRRARRANPSGLVVATGCYAQRSPDDLQRMPGVSLVVDNAGKMRLPELLGLADDDPAQRPVRPPGRTRSMVKIQEGCHQVCAYCIVPRTRGRERSMPLDALVRQVRERVREGYREVILTGTQLGSYGFEFGPPPAGMTWYEALVRRILDETGIERLRFSSLQPQEITPGMVQLYAEGRLCPHVHMPLQSGSDNVLRRMRRRYNTALYAQTVDRLRDAVPDIGITTDIIVGFPGETDAEFEEGCQFVERIGFSAMHVFPYSRRPGTSAAHFPAQVDPQIKRKREARMLALSRRMTEAYHRSLLGRTAKVLWENEKALQGRQVWSGLTERYVRGYSNSAHDLHNRITPARLTAPFADGLWCELLDTPGEIYRAGEAEA